MKITQTENTVSLEYSGSVSALDIRYRGNFVGEIHGNTVSGVKEGRMIIAFLEPPQDTLMTYEGNFNIISYEAYNDEGLIKGRNIKKTSDELNKINSKWSISDTKYEDFNKSNRYKKVKKTELTYTRMGKKVKLNHKNKEIVKVGNGNK